MKSFNISAELKPFLIAVLNKREIPFLDRNSTIKADCSGTAFHKAVTRARCEKKNQEENLPPDTTYYVKKVESQKMLHEENTEYIRFLEM